MKTIFKIIGFALLAIIITIIVLLVYISKMPAAPDNYAEKNQTGGSLEAQYLQKGSYEIASYEQAVMQVFEKYIIYYPVALETQNKKYPVIILCNGTGVPVSKYLALPKHLASWGFIVIGTEETYAWNGFGAEMSFRHLERLNNHQTIDEKPNIFYQKIDLERVGITGHSQGGVGVLNAITAQEHHSKYRAAAALSPTNKELAHNLEWDYDAAKVDTPILLLSGEGGGDDWVVTGEQLEEIFQDIAGSKVMARRKNTDHGTMLYAAHGYVTAWFLWHLQQDENAAKAFSGDSPEIMQNSLYTDQKLGI